LEDKDPSIMERVPKEDDFEMQKIFELKLEGVTIHSLKYCAESNLLLAGTNVGSVIFF
jgi:hypothetical protein